MMGHLNSFSASGVGNLNKNFPKIQMPGGVARGGMFKLRFDWYIIMPRMSERNITYVQKHKTELKRESLCTKSMLLCVYSMCSPRKYPYSLHRRDWNFLGGGRVL